MGLRNTLVQTTSQTASRSEDDSSETAERRVLREGSFLMDSFDQLPFKRLAISSNQPIVIVAPHPDDETLGCGGAIAQLTARGHDVRVLVITDGTQSHPNSQKFSAAVLKGIREQETTAAMSTLGVDQRTITFLGVKDGSVPQMASAEFVRVQERCCRYLRDVVPGTIFLPWRYDPHPDHRATWQIIQAAVLETGRAVRYIEYPIWDWDSTQQKQLSGVGAVLGWRLDMTAVLEQKRRAIALYRSQLGDLIDDDPEGFSLTPEMLKNFTQPWEVFFEEA